MAVLLETSKGDIVIDLLVDQSPKCCENFLKLCKLKYYNYSPVYNVQKGFSFQTGDPIGPGSQDSDGGSSVWGLLEGTSRKTFVPDHNPRLKHTKRGTVSMATALSDTNNPESDRVAGSQFIVTLGDHIEKLDGAAAVFGHVVEGLDVLDKIGAAYVDSSGRPLQDIRIRHTIVLDDPFPDPDGLVEPPESPVPTREQLATVRIADDEKVDEEIDQDALEELRREREARAQALTLEMVGDLPFAEVKPPENVLFVCKLNPATQSADLDLIFSRFGKIVSCEVIRDKLTGDSLQYAFIEFDQQESCEQAYFKMQDVLIDDHRIHVDFSQSVSRISSEWRDGTNARRRRHHGASFAGIAGLERKRQYKDEDREGFARAARERATADELDADRFRREHEARERGGRDRRDRDREEDRERDSHSRRDRDGGERRERADHRDSGSRRQRDVRDVRSRKRRSRSRSSSPRPDRYRDDRRDDRRDSRKHRDRSRERERDRDRDRDRDDHRKSRR